MRGQCSSFSDVDGCSRLTQRDTIDIKNNNGKWPLISRWSLFCRSVSLMNVTFWADGCRQSSIRQKIIQGISHNCYKQMFCSVVTSNDLLRHIIIRCQLLWLWLPSWISDGLACSPVSLSSLWRQRKWISPTACAHISHLLSFTPHHSCRLLQSTILHMKPSRLNKHDQLSHPSPFRALKVFR